MFVHVWLFLFWMRAMRCGDEGKLKFDFDDSDVVSSLDFREQDPQEQDPSNRIIRAAAVQVVAKRKQSAKKSRDDVKRATYIDNFPGAAFISKKLNLIYRITGSVVGYREKLRKEYPRESAFYDAYMKEASQRNRHSGRYVKSLHSVVGRTVDKSGDVTERAEEIAHDVESLAHATRVVQERKQSAGQKREREDKGVESSSKIGRKEMPVASVTVGTYDPLKRINYSKWKELFPGQYARYLKQVKERRDMIRRDPELWEIERQKKRERAQLQRAREAGLSDGAGAAAGGGGSSRG